MPEFLDLPNEILLHIIDTVSPYDGLESLTMCSRFLYELGEKTLEKHRKSKTRHLGVFCDGPTLLVRDILQDKTMIPHITSLIVNWPMGVYIRNPTLDRSKPLACYKTEIADTMEKCVSLSPTERVRWSERVDFGEMPETFALLIHLLPNLRRLHLSCAPFICRTVLIALCNIFQFSGYKIGVPHSLRQLYHLSFDNILQPGYTLGSQLWSLVRLPSLRSLSIKGVHSYELFSYGLPPAQISSLSLKSCCVDALHLGQLIKASDRFKDLTYRYGHQAGNFPMREHMCTGWKPQQIVSHLLLSAKQSLVSLDLSFLCKKARNYTKRNEDFIGSLQAFQSLKTLRIEQSMFIEVTVQPDDGVCHSFWKGRRGAKGVRVHHLTLMLPCSLQSLTFVTSCSKKTGKKMMKGFFTSKWMAFPELNSILFRRAEKKKNFACA